MPPGPATAAVSAPVRALALAVVLGAAAVGVAMLTLMPAPEVRAAPPGNDEAASSADVDASCNADTDACVNKDECAKKNACVNKDECANEDTDPKSIAHSLHSAQNEPSLESEKKVDGPEQATTTMTTPVQELADETTSIGITSDDDNICEIDQMRHACCINDDTQKPLQADSELCVNAAIRDDDAALDAPVPLVFDHDTHLNYQDCAPLPTILEEAELEDSDEHLTALDQAKEPAPATPDHAQDTAASIPKAQVENAVTEADDDHGATPDASPVESVADGVCAIADIVSNEALAQAVAELAIEATAAAAHVALAESDTAACVSEPGSMHVEADASSSIRDDIQSESEGKVETDEVSLLVSSRRTSSESEAVTIKSLGAAGVVNGLLDKMFAATVDAQLSNVSDCGEPAVMTNDTDIPEPVSHADITSTPDSSSQETLAEQTSHTVDKPNNDASSKSRFNIDAAEFVPSFAVESIYNTNCYDDTEGNPYAYDAMAPSTNIAEFEAAYSAYNVMFPGPPGTLSEITTPSMSSSSSASPSSMMGMSQHQGGASGTYYDGAAKNRSARHLFQSQHHNGGIGRHPKGQSSNDHDGQYDSTKSGNERRSGDQQSQTPKKRNRNKRGSVSSRDTDASRSMLTLADYIDKKSLAVMSKTSSTSSKKQAAGSVSAQQQQQQDQTHTDSAHGHADDENDVIDNTASHKENLGITESSLGQVSPGSPQNASKKQQQQQSTNTNRKKNSKSTPSNIDAVDARSIPCLFGAACASKTNGCRYTHPQPVHTKSSQPPQASNVNLNLNSIDQHINDVSTTQVDSVDHVESA